MKYCFLVISMFALLLWAPAEAAPQDKIIGPYSKTLTQEDKAEISFIIDTLSSHSVLGLWGYEKKLKEAGAKVEDVHPLRHLGYVFSMPELASKTKKIASFPWKRYVKGFEKPLNLAVKQGKMGPDVIDDFAKKVGMSPETVQGYVDKGDWSGLINALRSHGS